MNLQCDAHCKSMITFQNCHMPLYDFNEIKLRSLSVSFALLNEYNADEFMYVIKWKILFTVK